MRVVIASAALAALVGVACSPNKQPRAAAPTSPRAAQPSVDRESLKTSRLRLADGAFVTCYETSAATPKGLVLYLQGSGYESISGKVKQLTIFSRLGLSAAACEKRGAGSKTPEKDAWPYASLEQRVADSMAALDHFRSLLPAGCPVVLFAASEGGDVAARLAAAQSAVTHAILLGTGGGLSQAEELRLFIETRGEYLGLRSVTELDAKLAEIRSSADGVEAWAGHPMLRWRSYLFRAPLPFWQASKAALLVIHGTADVAVPVESARKLVQTLSADRDRSTTYVELRDVGHDFRNAVTGDSALVRVVTEIADWLVDRGLSEPRDRDRLLAGLAKQR